MEKKKPMETDEAVVRNEPVSQSSTTSSTPVPPNQTTQQTTMTTTAALPTALTKTKQPAVALPEVDVYLHLLVLIFAIDKQKYKQVIIIII